MLRRAIMAYGLLCLVVAAVLLFAVHAALAAVLYLAINGAAIVGGLVFERRRYGPALDRRQGYWLPTGERFVDPTSGELMEVHYNPTTGQRNYVPADDET